MEELEIKLDMYEKEFGESFPTFNFVYLSFEEMGEIIDKCLDEGKDVYELGILKDDPNIKY